jgi:hypothetical protein
MLSLIAIVGSLFLARLAGRRHRDGRTSEAGVAAGVAMLVLLALGGSLIDCRAQGGCTRRRTGNS